uniref:Uncharacterized protein n=1 Tax=Streptomyces avermitilis TaxID=33903 RepID=A0A499VEQ8_STRAX|nr:hypothetical protein SAVMC3_55620 [Streptomyces avermitilis]
MHGADDVHPRLVLEEAELGAHPWVEVEELVLAVAPVEAQVEVDDAAEADLLDETRGEVGEFRIVHDVRVRRHPGVRRPGADLHAGEHGERGRVRVEVGVHDPVFGLLSRQVLLEDHSGVVAPVAGEREQSLAGGDPRRAVHRGPGPADERFAVLGHEREAGLLGEAHDVVVRLREGGRRAGDAVLHAQFVQPLFAGEPARELGVDPREEEAAPVGQCLLVLGDQDGRLFVGRDEDGRTADQVPDAQQPFHEPFRFLRSGGRPDEGAAQIARGRRGRVTVFGHRIHRYAEPSQAADGAHTAVMQRVVAELDDQPRHVTVRVERHAAGASGHGSPTCPPTDRTHPVHVPKGR